MCVCANRLVPMEIFPKLDEEDGVEESHDQGAGRRWVTRAAA